LLSQRLRRSLKWPVSALSGAKQRQSTNRLLATPATVETKPEAAGKHCQNDLLEPEANRNIATPAAPVPEATPKATDTTIPQQAKVEAGENIDAKKDDVLPPPIAPVLNVAPPTQ